MKKFTVSLCCIALCVLCSSCQKKQQQAVEHTAPPPTEQKAPDPGDMTKLVQKAALEYENGDYLNCQATLQGIVTHFGGRVPIAHDPKFGAIYYRKGICELKLANDAKAKNNPEEAGKWFGEAAKSFQACYKQFQSGAGGMTKTTNVQHKAALQLGDMIADKLMQSLGSKLKAALQAGGPEHALIVCQQLAEPSTMLVSEEFEGASIKRVSLKPRNPRNAPDGLDRKVLTGWQKQVDAGQDVPKSEMHSRDDGTAVFYRPIVTQDVCMNCHGDPATFSQGLVERLAELYPKDKATGYGIDQLRGAFRVEFLHGK